MDVAIAGGKIARVAARHSRRRREESGGRAGALRHAGPDRSARARVRLQRVDLSRRYIARLPAPPRSSTPAARVGAHSTRCMKTVIKPSRTRVLVVHQHRRPRNDRLEIRGRRRPTWTRRRRRPRSREPAADRRHQDALILAEKAGWRSIARIAAGKLVQHARHDRRQDLHELAAAPAGRSCWTRCGRATSTRTCTTTGSSR